MITGTHTPSMATHTCDASTRRVEACLGYMRSYFIKSKKKKEGRGREVRRGKKEKERGEKERERKRKTHLGSGGGTCL